MYKFILLSLLFGLFLSSCGAPKIQDAQKQILGEKDLEVYEGELEKSLKSNIGFISYPKFENLLQKYLNQIIQSNKTKLKNVSAAKIKILDAENKMIACGFKNHIYLSKGLIGTASFDSEMAFILSLGISFLEHERTVKNYVQITGQDFGSNIIPLPTQADTLNSIQNPISLGWFSNGGLFDYGTPAYLDDLKEAVMIAGNSHFDPRGSTTVVKKWNSKENMPMLFPKNENLYKLVQTQVARLSPQRNPLVKTIVYEEFFKSLNKRKSK